MNFLLLEDRASLNDLDPRISSMLRDLQLIEKNQIMFCGVATADNTVLVVPPRNSLDSISKSQLSTSEVASLLLRALHRYSTQSKNALKEGGEIEESGHGLGILSSILWLLRDYSNNGLYTKRARSRDINRGKVNWRRTIARSTPLMGLGGAPVYLDLHSDRVHIGSDSIVSQIHAEIIREVDTSFGWLLTGDESVRVARELDFSTISSMPDDQKIFQLKKELTHIYGDRDNILVNTMINYIESRFTGLAGEYLIGVGFFHTVWEEMLRNIVPGVIDVNRILPKPLVYLENGNSCSYSKGMLTDIVSQHENRISVIDAKYYGASGVDNVPGWPDIVKQVYYTKSLQLLFPESSVSSWFVFPGKTHKADQGPIQQFRIANPSTGQLLDGDFPPIGCGYFCPLDVMRRYISSNEITFEEIDMFFEEPKKPEYPAIT